LRAGDSFPLVSDQVDLLDAVLDKTGALLANTPGGEADRPTPCPDLTVADLVDHLVEWIGTFAESATGSPPPVTGPAGHAWPTPQAERFADAARQAVGAFRDGAVDRRLTVMGGPIPGSMVVGMMLMEYLGHGWDLAVATGQTLPYTDVEAAAALAAGKKMLTEQFRGPDKSFGPEVTVPSDATAVERLIGFLGRDPYWKRP
jgi:uncharacterized protein (TIGR03086 family)